MAKASASNPYGTDRETDKNGVATSSRSTSSSSSSKSSSSSTKSSSSSSSSSGSKVQVGTGTYDSSKNQGAQFDGVYDDVADRPLDDYYYAKEEQYKQQYEDARNNGDWEGMLAANEGMNQVRNDYGLAAEFANEDINNIKNKFSGSSGGSSSSGGNGNTGGGVVSNNGSNFSDEMKALLDAWKAEAQQQSDAKIDYAVNQAVAELERAKEDAQGQFKEQQEQITLDERQGMDNTALYAELRGDKGGIGKEQYSSVQNTAAQNRLAVSQAQTKLATDTARQIEDLRAHGEFQKADAALEIAQNYLSQLISLEQWAAEYNLSTAQFQEAVRQWETEFQASMDQFEANLGLSKAELQASMDQFNANMDLSKAELTGAFSDGTPTLSAKNQITQQLASMGESLLSAGVMPTTEQLSAMGMTEAQAKEYLTILAMEKEKASSSSSSSLGDKPAAAGDSKNVYRQMYDQGITSDGEAYLWLIDAGYSSTEAGNLVNYYTRWLTDNKADLEAENREPDSGLQQLQAELNRIQDSGNLNTVGRRASELIESYYKRGSITEETAKRLLGQYGFSV